MPSSNSKALSTFCGMDVDKCNVKLLYEYIGTKGHPMVPFQINYKATDEPVKSGDITLYPRNVTAVPCNEGLTNDTAGCSCQDCNAACSPPPPDPIPPKPWTVLGVDGMFFLMFCCFGVFLVAFGSHQVWYHIVLLDGFNMDGAICASETAGGRKEKQQQQQPPTKSPPPLPTINLSDIGFLERLGATSERHLTNGFRRWGTLAATHPIRVLVTCAVVTVVLASGLALFQVTTDPVQLWSAPDSRARTEKNYFDSNFA